MVLEGWGWSTRTPRARLVRGSVCFHPLVCWSAMLFDVLAMSLSCQLVRRGTVGNCVTKVFRHGVDNILPALSSRASGGDEDRGTWVKSCIQETG